MDFKTKNELIASVAAKTYISKGAVETVVQAFLRELRETIESGTTVRLAELGVFTFTERKECTTINPKTGDKVTCPSMLIPRLKFNKTICKNINHI